MLYNKYRPQKISELKGQPHLQTMLYKLDRNNVPNSIILSGSSGIGKTTTARLITRKLFADSVDENGEIVSAPNIETLIDYVEFDAAENSGVEDMRDLKEKLLISSWSGIRVVYIDEAHNLSKKAWDALLKVIEESKSNVFLFATTEADKIPATIVNRSVHYKLQEPTQEDLISYADYIAKNEGYEIEKAALGVIVFSSSPSFRDVAKHVGQVITQLDNSEVITVEKLEKLGIFIGADEINLFKEFPKLIKTINNTNSWFSFYKQVLQTKVDDSAIKNFLYYMYNYTKKVVINTSNPNDTLLYLMYELSEVLKDTYKPINKVTLDNIILRVLKSVRSGQQ